MGRTEDFMRFPERQYLDTSRILDEVGQSVTVQRRTVPSSGKVGIDTEHGEYANLRRITAYIEIARSGLSAGSPLSRVSSEAAFGMKYTYLGITTDDDVKLGDKWIAGTETYIVQFTDNTHPSKTEVGLEKFNA